LPKFSPFLEKRLTCESLPKNPDCSNSKILDAQGAANKPEDIKRLQQEKPAVIASTNQNLTRTKTKNCNKKAIPTKLRVKNF